MPCPASTSRTFWEWLPWRVRTAGKIRWTRAIRAAAAKKAASDLPKLIKFVPFDPGTKMSEATAVDPSGATVRIVKGAFAAVAGLTQSHAGCVHGGERT